MVVVVDVVVVVAGPGGFEAVAMVRKGHWRVRRVQAYHGRAAEQDARLGAHQGAPVSHRVLREGVRRSQGDDGKRVHKISSLFSSSCFSQVSYI